MTATIESVRKSVTVAAPPERAFEVFTAGMTDWWPRDSHHISDADDARAILEPREGGRWYEIDQNGVECDWGYVIAWDPPHRLVLAWQLTGEWKYDAGFVTEVEVTFTPEGDGTRVDLEHRDLDRYGDGADEVRAALGSDRGWTGLLDTFAAFAG
jgi:uncharacterized protein YndB with AHSA1/START domain